MIAHITRASLALQKTPRGGSPRCVEGQELLPRRYGAQLP